MQATAADHDAITSELRQEGALLSSFLRSSREQADLTIRDAADRSDIDCEHLARIEIGAASPTAEELDRLCALYECDVDSVDSGGEFLPQLPSRAHRNGEWLLLGPVVISLEDANTNDDILDAVGRAVRQVRSLDGDAAVHIRRSEIPMIASLLNLECESLPVTIARTLRLSVVNSYELVEAMRDSLEPEKPSTPS